MEGSTDRGFFGFGHKDEDKTQQNQHGTAPSHGTQQGVGGGHQQGGGYGQQQPMRPDHGTHGTQEPMVGTYNAGTIQPGQTTGEEHKSGGGLKEKIGETLGINKLKKGHKKGGEEDGSSSSSSDEEDNKSGEKKKHQFFG
ncbi:hypothetical protein MPTK1_2g01360 [Marchantia polymorpha subsp. ruderalis]|nr:hypothetical protein MARPO_0028s0016 [Marchantia polymorpha]BBN00706.1 hypothetical protein Mp_2g01360 [Marchantia polymorpha subsp. ruderalis]|eukprot:PTQ42690.1 hypothetical protein MARPO_0028s0016 [Marchantia polymorpha]